MMKSNIAAISVIVALIVGFGAGFLLRPVLVPAAAPANIVDAGAIPATGSAGARSAQYFSGHIDEARRVMTGCQSGSVRGDECINAGQAVTEVDGRERFRKFFDH